MVLAQGIQCLVNYGSTLFSQHCLLSLFAFVTRFVSGCISLLVYREFGSLAPSPARRCVKSDPVQPGIKCAGTLEAGQLEERLAKRVLDNVFRLLTVP